MSSTFVTMVLVTIRVSPALLLSPQINFISLYISQSTPLPPDPSEFALICTDDVVDVAAATARNIQVSHTPGAVDDATATVGAFLTISCLRNFSLAERNGREGKWKEGWQPARDPEGRTVGIIGMGGIGQVSLSPSQPQTNV